MQLYEQLYTGAVNDVLREHCLLQQALPGHILPLRGVGRFLRSAEGFRRAFALSDSSSHAITFCQGSLGAAGEDLPALAREFAPRIAFLHFRDVAGSREDFRETFHDNGPTDMAAMIRLYRELALDVPIRVDHVPTLVGENDAEPGYAALGRLYAIGYLRGLIEASGGPQMPPDR